MIKEHIIDTYGRFERPCVLGGSGSELRDDADRRCASVMPVFSQGIQTGVSYPDAVESAWDRNSRLWVARNVLVRLRQHQLSTADRAALEGKPNTYCNAWIGSFLSPQVPTRAVNCGTGFPAAIVYDPLLRPNGVRCSIHDMMVNIFGTVVDTDRNTKPKIPVRQRRSAVRIAGSERRRNHSRAVRAGQRDRRSLRLGH